MPRATKWVIIITDAKGITEVYGPYLNEEGAKWRKTRLKAKYPAYAILVRSVLNPQILDRALR